jgi:hypothetical protein
MTGDEGGSGVCDASWRDMWMPFVYLVVKGGLFGPAWLRKPFAWW